MKAMGLLTLLDLCGYDFVTPQEQQMMGSTPDSQYMARPFVPIAVQEGWDIGVVNYVRQMCRTVEVVSTKFEREDGGKYSSQTGLAKAILPPLDHSTGETLYDPKPENPSLRLRKDAGFPLRPAPANS